MSHLSLGVRSPTRLFAFYVGNRTLALDLLEGFDYLDPSDPGLASMLEMTFAIFLNVLEVDDEGMAVNAGQAMHRAAQYLRSYCDPTYAVDPPFADWEVDLP